MSDMDKALQEDVSLEETFQQLEQIIARMESPDATLDESFLLYQNGIEKLKQCNTMLDEVEKKMLVLNSEGKLEEF